MADREGGPKTEGVEQGTWKSIFRTFTQTLLDQRAELNKQISGAADPLGGGEQKVIPAGARYNFETQLEEVEHLLEIAADIQKAFEEGMREQNLLGQDAMAINVVKKSDALFNAFKRDIEQFLFGLQKNLGRIDGVELLASVQAVAHQIRILLAEVDNELLNLPPKQQSAYRWP